MTESTLRPEHRAEEPGGIGLEALTPELLIEVLKRTVAYPEVIATSSALAARRSHLTCHRHGTYYALNPDDDVEAATKVWRQSLGHTGLPKAFSAWPLWCRSQEAQMLYDALELDSGYSMVCKAWRALIHSRTKVALCGVADQLPLSIETVIVACDWSEGEVGREQLHHLASLPLLQTLAIWNSRQRLAHGMLVPSFVSTARRSISRTFPGLLGLPARLALGLASLPSYAFNFACGNEIASAARRSSVPPRLPAAFVSDRLRHFVLMPAVSDNTPVVTDGEFVKNVAKLTDLHTLVLPDLPGTLVPQLRALVQELTLLKTLISVVPSPVTSPEAPRSRLTMNHVTHLTHLRSLDVSSATRYRSDRLGDTNRFAPEPVAGLTALQRLTLRFDPILELTLNNLASSALTHSREHLSGVPELTALTHLEMTDLNCSAADVSRVALAPALVSLHLTRCNVNSVSPGAIRALSRLTDLRIRRPTRGSTVAPEQVEAIGRLTKLQSLEIKGYATLHALSRLTQLTNLELSKCYLAGRDCSALGQLSTLQRLSCRSVYLPGVSADDVSTLLCARPELRVLALTPQADEGVIARALADLPGGETLSSRCPKLCHVTLNRVGRAHIDTVFTDLAKLNGLEVLVLTGAVTADALRRLSGSTRLRRLEVVLDGKSNADIDVFVSGLQSLASCTGLRVVLVRSFLEGPVDLQELPFVVLWRKRE